MATYCPNCSGKLLFSPSRQAMICRMCGGTFKPEEVGETEKISTTYDCNIYTCPSCGGSIAVTDTEVSTSCVYCGNPTVIFDRTAKQQRPEGIIPFKLTRKEAAAAVRSQMEKAVFLPERLKNINEEDIKGIYIPYWLTSAKFYDCMTVYTKESRGSNSTSVVYGKALSCDAINMPVEAVTSIDDKFSKRIEPFDLNDLVDFDEDYLMGFYSNTPDISREVLHQTVNEKIHNKVADIICHTRSGTETHVQQSQHYTRLCGDEILLFCPCWFYTFVYKKKTYTFMINGQTGKIAGTLPWDKSPFVRKGLLLSVLFTAVMFVPLLFLSTNALMQWTAAISILLFILSVPLFLTTFFRMKEIKMNLGITQEGSVFNFVNKRKG